MVQFHTRCHGNSKCIFWQKVCPKSPKIGYFPAETITLYKFRSNLWSTNMNIYNTFCLEIQKQKMIWKTSDFIMALQSGWGFEDLKNVIFKHFQGQFS